MTDDGRLRLGNITVSADGISEWRNHRAVLQVAKADIHAARLRFASGAPRPAVSLVLGILLTLLGAYPLVRILALAGGLFSHGLAADTSIRTFLYLALFALFCGLLGFALILQAVTRAWCIEIATARGRRKAIFSGLADPAALEDFCRRAEREHGIRIDAA